MGFLNTVGDISRVAGVSLLFVGLVALAFNEVTGRNPPRSAEQREDVKFRRLARKTDNPELYLAFLRGQAALLCQKKPRMVDAGVQTED
jgi:hypothetical protein